MVSKTARRLRKTPTDAEIRLWSRLRYQQLDGRRFRRQHPMGRYVVDFVCLAEKLIIEVDGGQHAIPSANEDARTLFLEKEGFRIVRFWNNDVLANTDGVLEAIREALGNKS
ncbi:MAG: endonuclease domain-containing protein [Proteobacteria bacterium]|nr:endonuclease domain-containing protein [Pseudomonadota bacterium]